MLEEEERRVEMVQVHRFRWLNDGGGRVLVMGGGWVEHGLGW